MFDYHIVYQLQFLEKTKTKKKNRAVPTRCWLALDPRSSASCHVLATNPMNISFAGAFRCSWGLCTTALALARNQLQELGSFDHRLGLGREDGGEAFFFPFPFLVFVASHRIMVKPLAQGPLPPCPRCFGPFPDFRLTPKAKSQNLRF